MVIVLAALFALMNVDSIVDNLRPIVGALVPLWLKPRQYLQNRLLLAVKTAATNCKVGLRRLQR